MKKQIFYEFCFNCKNEVAMPIKCEIHICPICHNLILPCALCDMDEVVCSICKFTKK